MQLTENIYYYIAYGLILVTFFIVLKMPKNSKNEDKENEDKEKKDEKSNNLI